MVHLGGTTDEGAQVDLSKLTPGEKMVVIGGTILAIDLAFFPWHDLILFNRTAIQNPNSFWGTMALLLTIALVLAVALPRFGSARLPNLPVPWPQAIFLAGCTVAGLVLVKMAMETRQLAFGAWVGVVLGGVVAYGGYLMRQEAGYRPRKRPGGLP